VIITFTVIQMLILQQQQSNIHIKLKAMDVGSNWKTGWRLYHWIAVKVVITQICQTMTF